MGNNLHRTKHHNANLMKLANSQIVKKLKISTITLKYIQNIHSIYVRFMFGLFCNYSKGDPYSTLSIIIRIFLINIYFNIFDKYSPDNLLHS